MVDVFKHEHRMGCQTAAAHFSCWFDSPFGNRIDSNSRLDAHHVQPFGLVAHVVRPLPLRSMRGIARLGGPQRDQPIAKLEIKISGSHFIAD